eukprot:1156305-Pelagomonas_calceolata.AAC.1
MLSAGHDAQADAACVHTAAANNSGTLSCFMKIEKACRQQLRKMHPKSNTEVTQVFADQILSAIARSHELGGWEGVASPPCVDSAQAVHPKKKLTIVLRLLCFW